MSTFTFIAYWASLSYMLIAAHQLRKRQKLYDDALAEHKKNRAACQVACEACGEVSAYRITLTDKSSGKATLIHLCPTCYREDCEIERQAGIADDEGEEWKQA